MSLGSQVIAKLYWEAYFWAGRRGRAVSLCPKMVMLMCCTACWHSWQYKLSTSVLHDGACFGLESSCDLFLLVCTATSFSLQNCRPLLTQRLVLASPLGVCWTLFSCFCLHPGLLPAFYPHPWKFPFFWCDGNRATVQTDLWVLKSAITSSYHYLKYSLTFLA